MATVGYHESAPAVAVHEIGHSMFGLADEYAGGDGKPSAPNCVKKCSELTRGSNSLRKFDGFKCTKACQGTGFYAGGVTMMQFSESQFGAVNERCCLYLCVASFHCTNASEYSHSCCLTSVFLLLSNATRTPILRM